jgi:antitoxin component of MazEF toxin-antitoxin module
VDISVRDGKIVVAPAKRGHYRLDELLKGVTKKNLHRELDTGRPMGREQW